MVTAVLDIKHDSDFDYRGTRRMRSVLKLAIVSVLGAAALAAIVWQATHPDATDAKNFRYMLWKNGIHAMNLDVATGTMIADPERDRLVVGKTKAELRDKFGYLLPAADASPYLRACYQNTWWPGQQEVMFIRKSEWMVVFNGDRAEKLVLMKGC